MSIISNTFISDAGTGDAIRFNSSHTNDIPNLDFRNNIFSVGSGLGGYFYYSSYVPSTFLSDGNIFDGDKTFEMQGTPYANLAAWIGAVSKDGGSFTCSPTFDTGYQLAPTDTCAIDNGQDISAVSFNGVPVGTYDIDGNARTATFEDIGAHESN